MQARELAYAMDSEIFGALRYQVFVDQLGWLPENPNHVELDTFDHKAQHFGVFDGERLVGYVRIIQKGIGNGLLMQQPQFQALVPSDLMIDEHTAEVSRLCLAVDYQKRPRRGGLQATKLLFRAVAEHCRQADIRTLLAMANDADRREYSHKDFLMRLLPFVVVAGPIYFEPPTGTYLLRLDVPVALCRSSVRKFLGL